MRFELEHELPWAGEPRALLHCLYTDPGLNEALAAMPQLSSREVVHLAVDEIAGRAERTVRIVLDMPVPGGLRRLFPRGAGLGWEEHSTCDLDALTIDFTIRLPQLAARVRADGRYRLQAGGPGRVRRRIRGRVDVGAPVVGGLAERLVVSRLRDNMDEEARLTAAFLRERAA